MDDSTSTIVIDCGSNWTNIGRNTDETPSFRFETLVGVPRGANQTPNPTCYFGADAIERQSMLSLKTPVEFGLILNWDMYSDLLKHSFEKLLRVDSNEHVVALTQCVQNPKMNTERIAQLLFETFDVPALYMTTTASAALESFASDRPQVACLIEMGNSMINTVPMYEGINIPVMPRYRIAGSNMTDFLAKSLNVAYTSSTRDEYRHIKSLKEQHAFVSENIERDKSLPDSHFAIPVPSFADPSFPLGTLGKSRFLCTEPLFDPSLVGQEGELNLPETIKMAIERCDKDLRKELWSKIILCGGVSALPGLNPRLQADLQAIAPQDQEVHVFSHPCPQWSAWQGLKLKTLRSDFSAALFSKQDYEEQGPRLANYVFF